VCFASSSSTSSICVLIVSLASHSVIREQIERSATEGMEVDSEAGSAAL